MFIADTSDWLHHPTSTSWIASMSNTDYSGSSDERRQHLPPRCRRPVMSTGNLDTEPVNEIWVSAPPTQKIATKAGRQ